jgi:transmembrane 9 superfamily member 2/4
MSSIWLNKYYFFFGFLLLVIIILILTSSEISIVMIYFQLCNEDYIWWWRAFFTSGTSAVYLFLYSVFYFFTKLHVNNFVMLITFFGYMSIISFLFFFMTGSVGFISTFWFVKKIYSSIKVA